MGQYFVITIFLYFKDIKYFGLTTEQSSATFGVNCDVPNLHFPDTCVTDDDCIDFPNTVCSNVPINQGLDPGTRNIPFDDAISLYDELTSRLEMFGKSLLKTYFY